MSLRIAKDFVEIKNPVTGNVVFNTNYALPSILYSIDSTITVPNMLVKKQLAVDGNTGANGLFNDLYGIDISTFPITSLHGGLNPVVMLKIETGSGVIAAQNIGYQVIHGSCILELFKYNNSFQDYGAIPSSYDGMIAVNLLIDSDYLSIQVVRSIGALAKDTSKVGFYGNGGVLNHDVTPAKSVITDPFYFNWDATQYASGLDSPAYYLSPRIAELLNTSFTASVKILLLKGAI